jgi:hypothetical protein
MRAAPQRPSERGRITAEQVAWITMRTRVATVIDTNLAASPAPHMRLAIALVEDSLRAGDRAVGLT